DVGEARHLRRQDQTGRTAPDDQDIDIFRETFRALGDGRMRFLDERVAGFVSVEMELHRACLLLDDLEGLASLPFVTGPPQRRATGRRCHADAGGWRRGSVEVPVVSTMSADSPTASIDAS